MQIAVFITVFNRAKYRLCTLCNEQSQTAKYNANGKERESGWIGRGGKQKESIESECVANGGQSLKVDVLLRACLMSVCLEVFIDCS